MNRTLYHIITNVNSLAIAISSCIIFTLLLLIELRNNKIKPKSMLFFSILFALVAGFKGPVAMLIFATLLVILIIQLLRKKRIDGFVPFVSLISLIFILFYFYLFSAGTESTVSFNPAATVKNSVIGMLLRKVMGERSISNILYLILIPLHFIAYIPFQSLLYLNGLRSDIRRFFSLSASDYLINGMALGGITATYLFGHPGNSQVAFLHTALPYIALLAVRAFVKIKAERRWFMYLAGAIGFSSAIIGFVYIGSFGYANYQLVAGGGRMASAKYSISEYDQEAMEWLRDNTPEDSIFATNRLYQSARDDGRFFYYTAISERQAFLEGYAYTKNSGASDEFINDKLRINNLIFLDKVGNEVELLNLLKENNIDYIVWSKKMTEYEDNYRSSSFKKVFENRDVLIFEI